MTRNPIALAVAAHLGLDVLWAVLLWFDNPYAFFGLLVLLSAQTSLLAIWCALGSSAWWLRLLACLSSLAAATGLMILAVVIYAGNVSAGHNPYWMNLAVHKVPKFLVGQAVAVAVLLAVLRLARLRLVRIVSGPPSDAERRWQFSMLQLLTVTLVVSLIFSLARQFQNVVDAGRATFMMNQLEFLVYWGFHWREAVKAGLAEVLLAVWVALNVHRSNLRLAFALLAALAVGLIPAWYGFEFRSQARFVPAWLTLQFLIVTATLFVVRSCGYRLCRANEMEPVVAPC